MTTMNYGIFRLFISQIWGQSIYILNLRTALLAPGFQSTYTTKTQLLSETTYYDI